MNASQFIKYLEDPAKLEKLPYEELKTVVLQYPYCSNLRLLLLQKSLMANHEEYERDLHLAATYAKDRDQLFRRLKNTRQLVKEQDGFFFENSQYPETQNGSETSEQQKQTSEDADRSSQEEAGSLEKQDEGISLDRMLKIEDYTAFTASLDVFLDTRDFEITEDSKKEKDYATQASSSETSSEDRSKEPEEEKDDISLVTEETQTVTDQEVVDKTETPEDTDPFLSWLKKQKPVVSVMSEEEQEEARLKQEKAEEKVVIEKAQKSLLEKDDIVSETLARILEEQEQYAKAIEMYKRLSLIFPEKSHLFADRIEQLKKKK